ncbi:hypothetical protein [Desulfovibrio sp. UCD-KL4C]|uniref:hypothetical protein n=1 Tax=Desulfovibrio sp. UCD-KL4C TaxID=2578120 RepID=UPI0025C237D6|nr:hypothetical protein [Desulfovibrio sp. UCD-KL4C]
MRKKYIAFTILLALSCMFSGCTPKVKIKLLAPGDIKISGVSKIAILPFNSIDSNLQKGKYTANKRACDLARRCVENALYSEPYFQLVDLDLENKLVKIDHNARPKNRLNGILYGKVWWQISDEYENYMPSKMPLSRWVVRKYVCGRTKKGKPIYCSKRLTTQVKDKFYKSHYRTVTASLMMSLSVYRLSAKGQIEKVAQVFEIAKKPAIISNGQFSTNVKLVGFKKAKNRLKTLKTDEGFSMPDFSGMLSPQQSKAAPEETVDQGTVAADETESTPAPLNLKDSLANALGFSFKLILPPSMTSGTSKTTKKAPHAEVQTNKEDKNPDNYGKSFLDKKVTNKCNSIPDQLGMKNDLADAVGSRLKGLIQPHSEEFDIEMRGLDKKTQTMFITESFKGLSKYLALKITNKDQELSNKLIDSLEFEKVTEEMLIRKMKTEYAEKQAELPAEQRVPFVQPAPNELSGLANSYLDKYLDDIYNLGLAFEGVGDFERALEIYRFAFNKYANTSQDFADGIGRCTLALDMSVRNSEAYRAIEDAQEMAKLKRGYLK